MAAYQQVNSYLTTHYDGMAPEQLILLLFKGASKRLGLAREGILENDMQKKGENLSKAIAIISELNASVDSKMNDESTMFLRGLYAAILTELPKVTLNNDLKILGRAEGYIAKLTEIWEKDVMAKNHNHSNQPEPKGVKQHLAAVKNQSPGKGFHSISV